MNSRSFFSSRIFGPAVLAVSGLMLAGLLSGVALAVVAPTITAATGGSAISADTATTAPGSATYTTLTGPTIMGTGVGGIGTGTLDLAVSGGFTFQPGTGSVFLTGVGCAGLVPGAFTVTSTDVSLTTTGATTGDCTLGFGGLAVAPTLGTPLSVAGLITASGLASGPAGALVEVPGAPTKLIFKGTPGPGTPTALTQPVVAIGDIYGNTVTSASATVGLTLLAPDLGGPGSLTGCASVPTASGLTTFTNCLIGTVGVGYRLTATDLSVGGTHPYTPVTSSRFDVRDQLVFTASPLLAISNTAFSVSPVVAVRAGPTNTAVNDATTVVTLSISGSTVSGLPAFSSPSSTTFTPSVSNSFSVIATGTPLPVVSLASGSAPGVTFTSGSGSGTLSGIPTTPGTYPFVFQATSTAGTVFQSFSLTVGGTSGPVAFTSAAAASFVSSVASSFSVTASGSVIPAISLASGSAPGVSFSPGTGIALLYGTPTTPGTYPFTFNATSTAGTVTQTFTLTVVAAPPTLTCSGGLTATAVAGLATFSGCSIDKAGTYTLTASASGLTSATSSNLVISAGAAAKLGFTASPASTSSSTAFANPITVTVQDAAGNTIASGTASTSSVILALATNSSGGILACTSGLTMNAIAGVATFSGCSINNPGTYSLSAVSGFLGVALSPSFTVSAPSGTITLTASGAPVLTGTVITWGSPVTLTATFSSGGAGLHFNIQISRDGIGWGTPAALTNLVTNAAGVASYPYSPATNDYYRVVFAGAPTFAATTSAMVRVVTRQILILRPINKVSIKTISHGTSIIFTSTVRPSRTDLAPAQVTYRLYRLVSGTWVLKSTQVLTASSTGLASTTFTFGTLGSWKVWAAANPNPYNANSMPATEQFLVN